MWGEAFLWTGIFIRWVFSGFDGKLKDWEYGTEEDQNKKLSYEVRTMVLGGFVYIALFFGVAYFASWMGWLD